MQLAEALDFRRGDMAGLIGAGGKTTTMFRLAQELRKEGRKVLLTTTTKIFKPNKPHVDRLFLVEDVAALAEACAAIAPPVIISVLPLRRCACTLMLRAMVSMSSWIILLCVKFI